MQAHSLLFRGLLLVASVALFGGVRWGEVSAERLPLKNYSIADGLVSDEVVRIKGDSQGFLWFCTTDGLSRFDGYRFTNYTTAHGLPDRAVHDVLETSSGVYWVATSKGLGLFNPYGTPAPVDAETQPAEPMFRVIFPDEAQPTIIVNRLLEDRRGTLWVGTNVGLFRLEQQGTQMKFHLEEMGMPTTNYDERRINCLLEDRHGNLWVGTAGSGVYRRWPDGRVERYTKQQGIPGGGAVAMLEDREGRLWMADNSGLWLMNPDASPNQKAVTRIYKPHSNDKLLFFKDLLQTSDGRLWVGADFGLSEFILESGDVKFQTWTMKNGLQHNKVLALAEDSEGNLWFGTSGGGVHRLARGGFTLFGEEDGIPFGSVAAIFADQNGAICLINGNNRYLQRFDNRQWKTFRYNRPTGMRLLGWGSRQIAFRSRTGEWWFASQEGLFRFPNVSQVEDLAHVKPLAVYTERDGLVGNDIYRIFEDSQGNVWVTALHPARQWLSCWERATNQFRHFLNADGFPPGNVECYTEDNQGRVWINVGSSVYHYEAEQFIRLPGIDEINKETINWLHFDQVGRLWLATRSNGIYRVDDPLAERAHIVRYTTNDGLSSNSAHCITHDQQGRIYIATLRGLDRLDPATGKIVQYTTADGLGRGSVQQVFLDRNGAIWAASAIGLARLIPIADPLPKPPSIFIGGLQIAGVKQRVSELGEQALGGLTLNPEQNHLSLDFFAVQFGIGEVMKYQFKLEGTATDWSKPTELRSVNFANLAPGDYRFLVRAVSSNGLTSPTPAVVSFKILRPVWQRWWFVLAIVLGFSGIAFAFYRSHIKRIIELERIRARIATDLHDDIGSSLSQIAILSEVSRQRIGAQSNGVGESLAQIANTSRDLVDTMSDIVWAINPKRDKLSDLSQRMREFASDVFAVRDITFRFHGSTDGHDIKLDAETRRQLYLICKEAVNNAARHAQCTEVEITFAIRQHELVLIVQDNGQGFDHNGNHNGNGLDSMRQRARVLGGDLDIRSQPQQGTIVTLTLPFPKQNQARWRKYLPV